MKILVSCVGTRGDVHPALAFAVELRRLGAEVHVCVPPNFVATAVALGLPARPVGVEMRQAPGAPPPTPSELAALAGRLLQDQFDAVEAAVEGCDILFGVGAHQYAIRSVAEVRGVSAELAVYAPVSLPSPAHAPPGVPVSDDRAANTAAWVENRKGWTVRAGPVVNKNRARLGLAPVDDVLEHILGPEVWLAADPLLGPADETPGRTVLQSGAWLLPDPTPLPDELVAFLDAGEPPVYFGFGSMPGMSTRSGAVVAAARRLGRRALVSGGWGGLAPIDGGDDCFALGDVDHAALFPRVAAVVHHGGAGTTTTAARAGVPQVVVPMYSDQPYWASRVRTLGVGVVVEPQTWTADTLAEALLATLPRAAAARALAPRVRGDGAAVAARMLLGGGRGGTGG